MFQPVPVLAKNNHCTHHVWDMIIFYSIRGSDALAKIYPSKIAQSDTALMGKLLKSNLCDFPLAHPLKFPFVAFVAKLNQTFYIYHFFQTAKIPLKYRRKYTYI